jgi:hypothetical protein
MSARPKWNPDSSSPAGPPPRDSPQQLPARRSECTPGKAQIARVNPERPDPAQQQQKESSLGIVWFVHGHCASAFLQEFQSANGLPRFGVGMVEAAEYDGMAVEVKKKLSLNTRRLIGTSAAKRFSFPLQ